MPSEQLALQREALEPRGYIHLGEMTKTYSVDRERERQTRAWREPFLHHRPIRHYSYYEHDSHQRQRRRDHDGHHGHHDHHDHVHIRHEVYEYYDTRDEDEAARWDPTDATPPTITRKTLTSLRKDAAKRGGDLVTQGPCHTYKQWSSVSYHEPHHNGCIREVIVYSRDHRVIQKITTDQRGRTTVCRDFIFQDMTWYVWRRNAPLTAELSQPAPSQLPH